MFLWPWPRLLWEIRRVSSVKGCCVLCITALSSHSEKRLGSQCWGGLGELPFRLYPSTPSPAVVHWDEAGLLLSTVAASTEEKLIWVVRRDFFFFFGGGGSGDRTQSFVLAWQVLYHLRYIISYFVWRQVLLTLPGLASWVAEIADMYHHARLKLHFFLNVKEKFPSFLGNSGLVLYHKLPVSKLWDVGDIPWLLLTWDWSPVRRGSSLLGSAVFQFRVLVFP
jgi:hypothetical protein